jgi:hypothetical protein
MSETQALRGSPARTAGASVPASAVAGRGGRCRRVAVQLWSLLHAQALLDGTARRPGDLAAVVTAIEDDRQRLAARRAR